MHLKVHMDFRCCATIFVTYERWRTITQLLETLRLSDYHPTRVFTVLFFWTSCAELH